MEKATFAAGCFWGVEYVFSKVPGVVSTRVGFIGGNVENPTYKQVYTDTTGHAEVCEVTYDPTKVTYDELLRVFWENHDPTQVNRQGEDEGTRYRTEIFYYNEEQKAAAVKSKENIEKSGKYNTLIATKITPASSFYEAEEYHQQYLKKNGLTGCPV